MSRVHSLRSLALGSAILLAAAGLGGCGGSSGGGSSSASCSAPTGAASGGSASSSATLPGDGATLAGDADCASSPSTSTAPAGSTSVSPPTGNEQTSAPSGSNTAALASTETDGACPYISTKDAQEMEGNLIGRTTVVSTTPVGCNFYFASNQAQMVLQISTKVYADPIDANNAMVTMAEAGGNATSVDGIADGAALFQTAFAPGDGNQDWACVFVKGNTLVLVNTNQKSPSYNARAIAQAIAPAF